MSVPNKRKHRRVEVKIEVEIEVVFPEETFRPKKKGGHTLNISECGMKIMMFDVPESFYKKMLSPIRHAKIGFTLPTTKKHKVLHGKMVWFDYNFQKEECTFGICFETITPEGQQDMHDLIETLERQKDSDSEAKGD